MPIAELTSLAEHIRTACARDGVALLPFLAAGYPDLETTCQFVESFDTLGAGAIEIGFPFSDPIADGPVIQQAFSYALDRGLKVQQVFDAIGRIKDKIQTPLVAMVSYSIVYRVGTETFCEKAKLAGFSGLLVPDLPPPETNRVCEAAQAAGLDTVMLISPTTPAERRSKIAALCSGFVYYLSLSGVTGERDALPADLEENVRNVKQLLLDANSRVPVCVGFGLSKREHLLRLKGVGDGAIVGSAFVRAVTQAMESKTPPLPAAESLAKALLGK